tara:strand:- start:1672 stop:1845 length:174 start_codon:yes stop_codon:yes gene_type:complete
MSKKEINEKLVGAQLMVLAELLTVEDWEFTANDLLDALEGGAITCEEAKLIRLWLST